MAGLINGQLRPNHRKGGMMGAIMGRLFTAQQLGSFGGQVQALMPAGAPALAPRGLGQPSSLLQFRGKADDPQIITASVYAVGPGGPLTGILYWGSGNGQNQSVEFDIGCQGNANQHVVSLTGGTMVSVPATHLELQVRNDGNLLPLAGGASSIGIGNPVNVMASLGVGTKTSGTRAVRTVWITNGGSTPLAPNVTTAVDIPPFANSFIIMRDSANNSIQFELFGTTSTYDGPYTVPANTRCPETQITGWLDTMNITNTGAGNIANLAVLFFLSL